MEQLKKRVKAFIASIIYKIMRKDDTEIVALNRQVPYMNKPISEFTEDEIGMSVYVDYLESAIEKGADMIAVVSGFGTGKSSLIELLKGKYHGWSLWQDRRCERVYCQVNLWSQLESQQAQTLELHRSFLYQLIGTVYPRKSSYFSRRTGRNFGMFKISAESPFWHVVINFTVVLFAIASVIYYFADSIVASGLIGEKALNAGIIVGYLICAIVAILLIVRTEILFSSGGSEGKRQIEENELIDLYREHVLRPTDVWRRIGMWFGIRKHIIVVIEDMDRTQDGSSVYEFLKELRKYYVPNDLAEKNFVNRVTFVVNIMPEDKLREQCKQEELDDNYVYDKLFDYTLNLNRINIDNFDAILEALILEKRQELQNIGIHVYDEDNVHKIPGMQWIIYGKELSLRQVKERLNDSIVVFDSISEKFGKDSPEFSKCAAVAYLRSAFSKLFYSISDEQLEEMLNWYAKIQPTEDAFVKKYAACPVDEEGKFLSQLDENEEPFYKTLYRMMDSHLIDENYRTYFFNYPKSSHLYNVQQTRVRNLIVYNEKLTEEIKSDISQVIETRKDVVVSAMEKATELVGQLPNCVIYSPELWKVASEQFPLYLPALIAKNFSNLNELLPEHYTMLESAVTMEGCSSILCDAILNNDFKIVSAIRTYLLDKHVDRIPAYTSLFNVPFLPITNDELIKMKGVSLEHILQMTEGVVGELKDAAIDTICKRVLDADKKAQMDAEMFYVELAKSFGIATVLEQVKEYLQTRRIMHPDLEDMIYENVTNGVFSKDEYLELMNHMEIDSLETRQLDRITALNKPGMLSEVLCNKLREEGYAKTYLLNMIATYSNKITLSKPEYFHTMEIHGEDIWDEFPKLFEKIRAWGCEKYKDDMSGLQEYFMAPYPILTIEESRNIELPDTMFQLYDASRAGEDEGDAFVDFSNRQFRKSNVAFAILQFIATMDDDMIPIVFYKLDMRKVRFAIMSSAKKLKVVNDMRYALNLGKSKEIVRFMDFTECLIPELETEILPDIKTTGNGELCKAYIKAIQKSGKLTKLTARYLRAMPMIYIYGDMINEEMYKKKYYSYYVASKCLEDAAFHIEYEKLDVLWSVYMDIFGSTKGYVEIRAYMSRSKEFLKLIQNRNAYIDLPEESRMALATIPQDENTLQDVLGYSDEFVVEYFSKIDSFSSKAAAEKFVEIMEKYQKYAQKKQIYDNAYPKLENAQLKSKYTRLYHRANS